MRQINWNGGSIYNFFIIIRQYIILFNELYFMHRRNNILLILTNKKYLPNIEDPLIYLII